MICELLITQKLLTNMKSALIQNRTDSDLKAKLYPYGRLNRFVKKVCGIYSGEERYIWWKGSEKSFNDIQASRRNFWLDICYLGDGQELTVIKKKIHCYTMVTVSVTGLKEADVKVAPMTDLELVHKEHLQLLSREGNIIGEFEDKSNLFGILGVSVDATEDEIRTAFPKQVWFYHPATIYDNDLDKVAASAITQRLYFAYKYLLNSERRKNYRLAISKNMKLRITDRWEAWKRSVGKDKKNFILQALLSTLAIGAGITVSVLTFVERIIPIRIGSRAGAVLVAAGFTSIIYLVGEKFIADGVDWNIYFEQLMAGAKIAIASGGIDVLLKAVGEKIVEVVPYVASNVVPALYNYCCGDGELHLKEESDGSVGRELTQEDRQLLQDWLSSSIR